MIYDIFNLENKIAIVTGASSGIGKSVALTLAEVKANVILVDIRIDVLNQLVEQINKRGQKAIAIKADVSKKVEVDRIVQETLKEFAKIDILVNCAGINRRAPAEIFSEEDWDDVINTNLKGVFLCSQAVGKVMIKQNKGKIINISSINSVIVGENIPAYDASKGGVKQLTKALALAWAKYNINVNAIAPGYFKTPLTKPLLNDKKRYREITSRIPMQKWGEPEDLKGAVIFLASDASKYVSGHILVVDGGWLGR